MPAPIQLTGSIRSRTRLTQWAHLAVLLALGGLLYSESHLLLNANDQSGAPTRLLASALQARLNEVSEGLTAYMKNHDSQSLERIKAEGRETNRLMDEYKAQLKQAGQNDASARVEEAYDSLRGTTLTLLAADQQVVKARQAVDETHNALAAVLAKMQSSIKQNQLNSSSRAKALRLAAAEADNSAKNGARFNKAIHSFEELSRTRRAERWTEEAQSYFDASVNQANSLEQAEGKKQSAQAQFADRRKALGMALGENASNEAPGWRGLAYIALNGTLLILCIIFVWKTHGQTEQDVTGPLQNILQCMEAAAAGDTSRLPNRRSNDEVGQLAQATGRLIQVVARSENLIYHLAALVESSGDAIISHTLDGKILSWNKGAQRIYGYSAEEVKGHPIALLSPADEGAEMMEILRRIRHGERLQPFETLHQARNGRTVRAFVRVAAIHDSTRKIIGASFVAQDLSDTQLLQAKTVENNQAA